MLCVVWFVDFIAVRLKRKSNLFFCYFCKILPKYFHPKDVFENISVGFVTTQYVLYLWHKLGKHNPINCFKTKVSLHTKINSHQGLVGFLGLGCFGFFSNEKLHKQNPGCSFLPGSCRTGRMISWPNPSLLFIPAELWELPAAVESDFVVFSWLQSTVIPSALSGLLIHLF